MIVRLFEQRDSVSTDEIFLGKIRQDKTLIIFVSEWGEIYKTGDDCIHRLSYLTFV
jgi:hypothetical protein